MPQKKLPPPPIPAPTAKEIERAKTDRDARKRVKYQLLRVKQREEEIARWNAENADAGVYNLDDAFVPPPPPFPPPPLFAYNAYNTTIFFQGMFAFLWSAMMSFLTQPPPMLSLPTDDTQTLETQSLDPCPPAPQNTLGYDDVECAKSEWDMLSVALAMYELSWVECRQKTTDERPSKRNRTQVMPNNNGLRRENTFLVIADAASGLGIALWKFLSLLICVLPNLGARAVNIFAMIAMIFLSLYVLLSRGWGDYLVRSTQMAIIGLIFPNATADVKEF